MKSRNKISIALSFVIAAALMYYILRQIGFESIPVYISRINPLWIGVAIVLYTIDMLVRAYRWQQILHDNGIAIKLRDSFFAYNLGNSLNILIPAKIGDVARSYYIKNKYHHGYTKTLPATFLDRVFDVIGVYIVILFCSIYVLAKVQLESWFYNLMLLGVAALVLVFVFIEVLLLNKRRLSKIKNDKLRSLLKSLVEVFHGSVRKRSKFLKLILCSVFIWLCDGLFTFFMFLSMREYINPIITIFANMIATLTKVFPITPGGLGVFEGAMIIVFSLFGLKSGIVGMVSTLDHLLMNLYTIFMGMVAMFKEHIKVSKIRLEKVGKR